MALRWAAGACLTILAINGAAAQGIRPLQEYVGRDDNAYQYTHIETIADAPLRIHLLELTSQEWKSGFVAPAQWRHWLVILEPVPAEGDLALLFAVDAPESAQQPVDTAARYAEFARHTGGVVAVLIGMPLDQLSLADEPLEHQALLEATVEQYIATGNPDWLLPFPMVKSVVRAMDAVQRYLLEDAAEPVRIARFAIAGTGRMGWPVWLTPPVDYRVHGLVSAHFDYLNMADYLLDSGIQIPGHPLDEFKGRLDRATADRLSDLMDPYRYRYRLTLPKLLMVRPGNQGGAKTGAAAYYDGLLGEKWLVCHPELAANPLAWDGPVRVNTAPHNTIAANPVLVFLDAVRSGGALPRVRLSRGLSGAGRVEGEGEQRPNRARLWAGQLQPDDGGGAVTWDAHGLSRAGAGAFRLRPDGMDGWPDRFFAEVLYEHPEYGYLYSVSTPVMDRLPRRVPPALYIGPGAGLLWLLIILAAARMRRRRSGGARHETKAA